MCIRDRVKDAHDSARNIDPSVLPEEVQINRGWAGDVYSMMSGIQHGDWDAAVFTGYHAAACCDGNPLSHTMNTSVDYVEINGVRASEFTLNAYMAGYHGVPVCFVSVSYTHLFWRARAFCIFSFPPLYDKIQL